MKVMILGCGFLSSHIAPYLTPHVDQFILVDREKIEHVNYDNYIIPKYQKGRRKVTAFASLLQILSECRTTPIHMSIKDETDVMNLISDFGPDLVIVGFDNIRSRIAARNALARAGIPAIHIGVNENYIYIDWNESVSLPDTEERIKHAEADMARVRKVCSRLEFRGLGAFASAAAYHSIVYWMKGDTQLARMIPIDEDGTIHVTTLRR